MKRNIERARFIASSENLNIDISKFDRIYFGNEFTDTLLPSAERLKRLSNLVKKDITLVTPFITQGKIDNIAELLEAAKVSDNVSEVVVNDFGVLRLMSRKFKDLIPIAGRVLVKQKTDPRHYYESYSNKESSLHTSLSDIGFANFLKKNNVKMVELNNTLQGADLPADFSYSLHYPHVIVALKRIYANAERESFILQHECMKEKLLSNGYAFFYMNKTINPAIKSKLDRIIFSNRLS